MPKSLTVDLDEPVLEALDRAAERSARTRADIIGEAVRDYLETQRWHIEKIESGIAAADRGDFATEDELNRVAGKYAGRNEGRLDPPAMRANSCYADSSRFRYDRGKNGLDIAAARSTCRQKDHEEDHWRI